MGRIASAIVLVAAFWVPSSVQAQDRAAAAQRYFKEHAARYQAAPQDLDQLLVTDMTQSEGGWEHIYLRQAIRGIGIYGAEMSVTFDREGRAVSEWAHAVAAAESRANLSAPVLSQMQAIEAAAFALGWPAPKGLDVRQVPTGADRSTRLAGGNISQEDIPLRLMYVQAPSGSLRLVWDFSVLLPSGQHWWSLKVDAENGEILDQVDWTAHCRFDGGPLRYDGHRHTAACDEAPPAPLLPAPNSYVVFKEPIESPNHGPRSSVTAPWNLTYSPFGWHDTNGATGAEFTITRGNNVWAQEDANANDGTGFSPDGGPTLDFNFPLNLNTAPSASQSAAITNLFYWSNLMHDVWAKYGFDAASGNFQQNNYGAGGTGNDYVLADAQDGSGMDNANFSTPVEGTRPRMQMYLWTGQVTTNLVVNSPGTVAGNYVCVPAEFGPTPPVVPLTANLVLVNDGTASPSLGCNALTNGGALNGKIALIDRGTCTFVNKVQNAQNAGAIACIVCNNVVGSPITMGGASGTITIPAVMISQSDCALLKAQLANNVNVSLSSPGPAVDRDGDYDNMIIAHEYGHGISTRLTGGPSNSNCLNNAEQMGEGWSDWFGLMMTMEPGDQGSDVRGVGTYAVFQPTNGTGIRPAPYSTNMSVNPYTYGDITNAATISQPHGIGFLWCSMLWEMTWQLVDHEGFDPDLINGTGGNNVAMRLVTHALKLQPCGPGFVDGRNAILRADTLLYGAQHACLIWEAFAKRGLGLSASQGSANNRSDGSQAFNTPACAVAFFSAAATSACAGAPITFADQSAGSPTAWSWNFGDGGTSTQQNPSHAYATPGNYTVTLTVTVGASSNTFTRTSYITVTSGPSTTASITPAACGNNNGALAASSTGGSGFTYLWSNGATTATISSLAPGTYTVTTTNGQGCVSSQSFTVPNQTGPSASISGTTATACGASTGTATAAGTGGTGTLTYTWSNGGSGATISGLTSGSYTVTVTDQNGCTATAIATVSNSSGPSATISATQATSCGLTNGTVTASATGGTGALSYLWSNGASTPSISNLAPGAYTLSVTDQNGCLSVATTTVNASTAPSASISSAIDASCGQANGSATVSATGGSAGYTYLWSNGATTASITGLGAGTYSVTVTDQVGCTTGASATLQAFTTPAANVVATELTCYGIPDGTVTANPSGGNPPYTYQWSNGVLSQQISGLAPALYFVTVTDASGCAVIGYGVVNEPLELISTASATGETALGANDGTATVTASGGTPPYTYTWSNGATTPTISGLPGGTYTVTVTDDRGCEKVSTVTVDAFVVGTAPSLPGYTATLWPNPNGGSFTVRVTLPSPQDVDLRLYNTLGQLITQRQLSAVSDAAVDFSGLPLAEGVYHLQIGNADFRMVKKVVVGIAD
jgi:PKD repeat protein